MDPTLSPQSTPQQNHVHHFSFPHITREWLFIIVAFILGCLLTMAILPKQNEKNIKKQTVTIVGTGTVEIPADQMLIYGRLNTVANTEQQASEILEKDTESLKKSIIDLGISEDQINIGMPYVSPPYTPTYEKSIAPVALPKIPPPPASDVVLGERIPSSAYTNSYVGSNNFDITLTKNQTGLANKIIAIFKANKSGVLDGKPNYLVKNYESYTNQAREKALQDAKNQVERIAKINNLQIVKVISIKELTSPDKQYNVNQPPYFVVDPLTKKAPYTLSYQVEYELAPKIFPF